jgi:hypothetical protein
MIHKSTDDAFTNVDTLGGALHRSLKVMGAEAVGKEVPLRDHPGKGLTALQMGFEHLRRRARTMELSEASTELAIQQAQTEFAKGEALCESPIERAMLAALITGEWSGFATIPPRVHNGMDKDEMLPWGDILIIPQMAFLRYRLDFGVLVRVAVECDGADFHNDYRRENLRVAYLKSWNIPVFKFTGKEIHADPHAAARKAILGVCQWRDLL